MVALVRQGQIRRGRRAQRQHRGRAASDDDDEDDGKGVRLYQSIYETALRNQVPRPVIDDLIRIYSYDVDFQRKVQPGDSFEVLFAGEDEDSNDGKGEVLFASLTTGGETRKFYRYQTTDDSVVDYYDETGKSAKKFLVRKPLARRHHALGLRLAPPSDPRLHRRCIPASTGRRPMGTPIFASGNGSDRDGRLGRRLRQVHPHPPRQRLRDRLRPHVGVRARHGAGQDACARAR